MPGDGPTLPTRRTHAATQPGSSYLFSFSSLFSTLHSHIFLSHSLFFFILYSFILLPAYTGLSSRLPGAETVRMCGEYTYTDRALILPTLYTHHRLTIHLHISHLALRKPTFSIPHPLVFLSSPSHTPPTLLSHSSHTSLHPRPASHLHLPSSLLSSLHVRRLFALLHTARAPRDLIGRTAPRPHRSNNHQAPHSVRLPLLLRSSFGIPVF